MVRTLAVPMVTMIGLVGYIATGEIQAYRHSVAISNAVTVSVAVQDLVHELQRERGLTNGLLSGETRFRSDVDEQRPRSNAARVALDRLLVDGEQPGATEIRSALDHSGGPGDGAR